MTSIRRRFTVVDDVLAVAPAPPVAEPMGRATGLAAVLGGVIGLVAITGWVVRSPTLERVFPGAAVTHVSSAVSVVLLAAAWFAPRVVRVALSVTVVVVCLLTVVELVTALPVGMDHVVAHAAQGLHPNPVSVMCAVALGLLAVAHLLFVAGLGSRAQALALPVLLLNYLLALGYAFDISDLSKHEMSSRVTFGTTAAIALLSVAALAAVPGGALGWASASQDAGAHLVRRLLPLAVVGLPLLGFVALLGERHGWYAGSATAGVIVLTAGAAVGAVTWVAARRLARVDRRRAQAIAELTELRIDLERQVQERATQLQRRHNEIAVLEDRQRIAADLHDIVIQRLFAAGMYLQSGAENLDGETRRRLDSAVEAMDVAIKDLRASIFELGGWVRQRIDMTTAISDVCTESARVLGFEPDVLIDDPEEDSDVYREDLLAVLREALANVARHAEASAADVVLRVGDGFIWLSVTDDGRGIDETTRSSGTRNMAQRAREHGGDCTWTRMDPAGTRVLWRVPVIEPAA